MKEIWLKNVCVTKKRLFTENIWSPSKNKGSHHLYNYKLEKPQLSSHIPVDEIWISLIRPPPQAGRHLCLRRQQRVWWGLAFISMGLLFQLKPLQELWRSGAHHNLNMKSWLLTRHISVLPVHSERIYKGFHSSIVQMTLWRSEIHHVLVSSSR